MTEEEKKEKEEIGKLITEENKSLLQGKYFDLRLREKTLNMKISKLKRLKDNERNIYKKRQLEKELREKQNEYGKVKNDLYNPLKTIKKWLNIED